MSEQIRRQIHFYKHYEKPSLTVCPIFTGVKFNNKSNTLCDCEPLRQAVADECGVDGKCPVREYSFGKSEK